VDSFHGELAEIEIFYIDIYVTWLLKAVKIRSGEVLGESSIWLAILGQLNIGMLAWHHSDCFAPEFYLVQVSHSLETIEQIIRYDSLLLQCEMKIT
jgi:hypothetical protein